jgi:phospholipid-binding lipoprotein MlaA
MYSSVLNPAHRLPSWFAVLLYFLGAAFLGSFHADASTDPKTTSRATYTPITVTKDAGKNVSRTLKGKTISAEDDDLDGYREAAHIADPIEPVNRGFFWFNHQLYHYAFHPLSRAYKTVFPSPVRTGIYNVFDNLEFPIRFVNDLLQLQPKRAGLETEKFVINSTAGVGGIFRPANKVPWLKDVPKTDTGVTLAKWGVPHGCYVVWPVLGPKSLRDSVGFVGDLALYPVTWVTYGAVGGLSGATTLAVSGPDAARTTSDKIDTYDTLTRNSIDRYLSVRSAYEQNRKKAEGK